MVIEECNNCGKKISEEKFYCEECRAKETKKFERQRKANEKRQGESEVRKFNEYLKSGKRTY